MKRLLQLIALSLFVASCSSTSTLTLSVPQPSNVYLSKEVKNVGIINRSVPNVKYNKLDVIDKITQGDVIEKVVINK